MSTMCFRFESHRIDNCPFSKDVDVNIWVCITQHSSHWGSRHDASPDHVFHVCKVHTASVACSAQNFAFAFANPPLPRFSRGHSFFCTCLHSSFSSSFSCSAPAVDSHVFFSVMAAFGQTASGQNRIWPELVFLVFWPSVSVLCGVWCVVCVVGGWVQDFWASPLDRPPPPDRSKFRTFFSLHRGKFHSFFSLWGSSR